MFMTEGMISMLTKQDKVNADRAASMMRQQESVLKNLQAIIDVCEKNKFLKDVQPEDLSALKSYCAEMQAACATANLLTRNLREAYKAYLKQQEKKKAESKKAKKQEKLEEDDLTGFFDE